MEADEGPTKRERKNLGKRDDLFGHQGLDPSSWWGGEGRSIAGEGRGDSIIINSPPIITHLSSLTHNVDENKAWADRY